MSTHGLAISRVSVLRDHQPMVDATAAKKKAADLERKKSYLLKLRDDTRMSNAQIAREVSRRRGIEVTPQAVGKWFKSGAISSDNLPHLIAMAEGKAIPAPTPGERFAAAFDEPQDESKTITRLRADITVLRKAITFLALAANAKSPGVAKAFAALLEQAAPDAYYGERGFHALIGAGLPLAAEILEEEQDETPAPPERQSGRRARG